jgi:hypothetical protein
VIKTFIFQAQNGKLNHDRTSLALISLTKIAGKLGISVYKVNKILGFLLAQLKIGQDRTH